MDSYSYELSKKDNNKNSQQNNLFKNIVYIIGILFVFYILYIIFAFYFLKNFIKKL